MSSRDGVRVWAPGRFLKREAEKLWALMTSDCLEKRGNKASRERFLRIVAKAKDLELDPKDRR